LLARQALGDIDEGLKLASTALAEARNESPRAAVKFQALEAWGKLLAGERDAARSLFESIEMDINRDFEWRYRYARAALTGDDVEKAIKLLRPLAVASRTEAVDVMQL